MRAGKADVPKKSEKRPAGKPEKPLTITVRIPGPMAPLFKAMFLVHRAKSQEDFAMRAVCRWLVSEEAMSAFDEMVNQFLKT